MFFFSKVGPRSRSNFWCEQQCLPQEIEYILTKQRNWDFKNNSVGVWAFVIGLSQISSFLSCCRYTRKFKNQKLCCHVWEKGRDLTQSCDKNPYTQRTMQKATWQHKNATKNFDYTTIADRLRTVSWSNSSHPTGVVKPVYERSTFPLTATAV